MKKLFETKAARDVNYASSPLLASKTPLWRSHFLVVLVGLAFAGLLGRAAWIQLVRADYYQQQGELRYAHTLQTHASRGNILDRNGRLLATSVPAPSIWVDPSEYKATDEQQRQLNKLLGMSQASFSKRMDSGGSRFAWIRRQSDPQLWAQVQKLGIKGLHQDREYLRRYPEGESAAHVVGFTDLEDIGQEGIELALDAALQGKVGARDVVKDRLGRVIEERGASSEAANGRDIQLSIDTKIQYYAYERLKQAVALHGAKAGSVVVLDTQTGEILALANFPSYDPGQRKRLSGEQLRNRAVTDIFEPGSTMKPFVIGWALDSGKYKPQSLVNASPGSVVVSGFSIRDTHSYGSLTVQGVLQKSSNIGTVRLAMQAQPHELWDVYSGAGFGQKPQLAFPGVVSGRLRPYKTWKPIEHATMAYGYGLSASLLQIARAYTVFARDGDMVPVSIEKLAHPVPGHPVFSPGTAREVRTMLQMAAGPGGTGTLAQTEGYSVGGKSGTAHKQEGGGYAVNKYRSWFVGLAPIDKPRIVVAVMVDEPSKGVYYGGAVAAPVFSRVVQQTLRMMGVPPDQMVVPQVVTKGQPGAPENF